MRAYLAGPMRGYPLSNFPAFIAAAKELRARGYEIVSPAELDLSIGNLPETAAETDRPGAFTRDITALMTVEAIILLPGWYASEGAKAEHLVAKLTGKQIFLYQAGELEPFDRQLEVRVVR